MEKTDGAIQILLLYHSLFVFHNSYMTWRHVPTLLGLAHRTVALVLSETVTITQYHITSFTLTVVIIK